MRHAGSHRDTLRPMPTHVPRSLVLILVALAAALAVGCAAQPVGDGGLAVPPDRYAEVFDAARAVLRDARFDLERVDARAGVITTHPKKSIGLFSPWDGEQSTLRQEADDLFNRQRRAVRVTFETPGGPPPAGVDLLAAEPAEITMRISVVVEREHQPGWRLESTSVRLNSRATDLVLAERGLTPWYTVAVAQDPAFAARLTDEVRRRTQPAQAPGQPGS